MGSGRLCFAPSAVLAECLGMRTRVPWGTEEAVHAGAVPISSRCTMRLMQLVWPCCPSQAKTTAAIHEDAASIANGCRVVAEALKTGARHATILTGAGISVASGVPDLTGSRGTVTMEQLDLPAPPRVVYETLRPSFTHEALLSRRSHASP